MRPELCRILLVIGIVLVVVGGLAALGVRLPFGRLPGDIAIEGERGGFYFPIVSMIVVSVILTIVFFVSVMTAALRVRLRRPIDDSEGVVGSIAEAQTDIAPEGTVLSNGTLWRARTMETGIAAGEKVQVKATEGLVLLVEPFHEGQPD